MDNTSTTAYWVAAAIILVLLVIGVALWYSATTTVPGVPNTGTTNTTDTIDNSSGATVPAGSGMSTSTSGGSGANYGVLRRIKKPA